MHAAREAAASAEVDVEEALAWRDFMVSDYSDAGQERWLADNGIDLLRGSGRLAGTGVVEVDGERHTAEHVVLANGADPIVPAGPGPARARGRLDQPRGDRHEGGSAPAARARRRARSASRWRRPVRRLGGEVALVEGAEHVLSREPAPLGEALGEVLRGEGIELALGVHAAAARRDDEDYVLELDDGRELRGDRLLVATGRRPRVEGIGLETVGIEADGHGIPVDAQLRAGERLWAIGDVNGAWPLTHVGKYEGEVVAANILGEPREVDYEAVPRVVFTDPQAASVGCHGGAIQRDRPGVRRRQDRHLHPRLRREQRLPDPAQRRRAPDRRLRARPRGRRVAAAGHAGDPGQAFRSRCCATRSSPSPPSRRSTSLR